MKVVFLDIDGVLNSTEYLASEEFRAHASEASWQPALSVEWWAYSIDPSAVERFNGLLEKTGAKVVVSSSWRLGGTLEWLSEVLVSRGFTGELVGFTPSYQEQPRRDEIVAWVETHRPDGYVVLDDDDDAEVEGRFVQTSAACGLTDADVELAAKILAKE